MGLRALDPLLSDSIEDLLHSDFNNRFYEIITASIEPPYAISIDGLWGTGKTTIMQILQSKLEIAGYPVFWFNPWKYRQSENVVLAFLQCLAAEHKDIVNDITKSGGKILHVLLDSGMSAFVKAITSGLLSPKDIKDSLKSIEDKQSLLYEKYQNIIETIEKEFLELVNRVSKKHNEFPVIIFFDDLDRCMPDDAIQLLEALKNLFVARNCKSIFICGIDTHVAKQFIASHYRGLEDTFAINYFRKIFNLTISMPFSPGVNDLLIKHIRDSYSDINGWVETEETKVKSLAKMVTLRGMHSQLSSVRNYLNVLSNFYAFLKFNPEYEFDLENDFVINMLIFKESWQSVYEEVIKEALRIRPSTMEQLIENVIKKYENRELGLDHRFDNRGPGLANPLNGLDLPIQDGQNDGHRRELLIQEQKDFLLRYLGKESPFAQKVLSIELGTYPTLA